MRDEVRGKPPLYIDPECFLAGKARVKVASPSKDMILHIIWLSKTGFVFDEPALKRRFAYELPAQGYAAGLLRRQCDAVVSFYVALPDGRWTWSPEYLRLIGDRTEQRG
jgi:hypothetical protein